MQNKTLLAKIVSVVALLCLALAMTFGLVACGNNEKQLTKDDKVVASVVLSGDKFQVTYVDGTKSEYAAGSVKDVKVLENGQTEITYADGTKATVGDANCNHAFTASVDVKPASCCEKGVKIQVCEKCGFVESIEVEKDPTVHGEWVLTSEIEYGELEYDVDEDEGIIYYSREDKGFSLYTLATQYICDSVTILEGYSGVADLCFKAECALCGEEFAAGHAPVDEWENIVVDDAEVNICENEHTVYKICPICKSVLQYEDGVIVTEKEPALGHIYGEPEVGDKNTNADPNYYPVTLHCERCGEDQVVRAYFEDEVNVPANCGADGYYYAIYKYGYTNFVDGVETIIYDTFECEYDWFENTGKHTLADGLMFNAYDNIELSPNYEYSPEIKAYFDNETIRWNNGEPASCSEYKLAGFTCTVCNELIVISLSGEHTLGEERIVEKTCTEDGYKYKTCTVCGEYDYKYDFDYAIGHNYQYVKNSFDEADMTAEFKCSICGDIIEVAVEFDSHVDAANCGEISYDKYVAEVPVINNDTATRTFNVYDEDELPLHTIAAGVRRYAAYDNNAQVPNYEFNDQLKALFENETIRWNNGEPADCEHYKLAGFTCTVCNKLIVISISGEHIRLDESDVLNVEPGCETRGYTAIKCLDCGEYIEQTATDAVGHNFAPDEASWSDFLALDFDDRNGAAVIFDCADCDERITLYAKLTHTNSSDGCVTTDTYKYDFYTAANNTTNYTYQVETAEETSKTITFKYSRSFTVDQGTHLVGRYNNMDERVIAYNMDAPDANKYEFGDQYKYFIENGIVRWNAGIPGTCEEGYALAGFDCQTCGKLIIFQLSGEHDLGEEITVEPDCTTDGYKYKVCTICGTEVRTAELPALGHDYGEWTVEGDRFAVAAEEDGVVYLEDYELGYAISVCARCQNELRAEGEIVTTVLPTCGKDGKLVVAYKFGNDTVATDTIVIPMIDHHITTLDTAEHVIKLVEDGIYKLGYVCEDCGKLVIVARSADESVIDDIISQLTADYVDELMGRA